LRRRLKKSTNKKREGKEKKLSPEAEVFKRSELPRKYIVVMRHFGH